MNNPSATPHRAAIYCRVSTVEQAVSGVSLDAQEERGRQWASYTGARIVEVVRDEGLSGKRIDRPGVERLWALIDAGEIDAVFVADLSRLTRSARDFANLIADFDARGVAFIAARENLDTGDTCGRLVAGIMSHVAEFERTQTADRTRAALAQVKREGRHIGRPPVGFTSKGGRLEVADPERVALAERAAAMSAAGESLRAIAEVLNAEGVPTGSAREGARWHPPAVSRLVRAARAARAVDA